MRYIYSLYCLYLVVVDICKTIQVILTKSKVIKYSYTFVDIHLMYVIILFRMQNMFLMYLKQYM